MRTFHLALSLLGMFPCHERDTPQHTLEFSVCRSEGMENFPLGWDFFQTGSVFKACTRDDVESLQRLPQPAAAGRALQCAQDILQDPGTLARIQDKLAGYQREHGAMHYREKIHWQEFLEFYYHINSDGFGQDFEDRIISEREQMAKLVIERMLADRHLPGTTR